MRTTFSNKEVVLCVTGSIAAYKACDIASRLVALGFRVTPALTASAARLIGPASLEAITGSRAITAMFDPIPNPEIEHIAVAMRASLFIVAPATANILAKAANGIADDWISTTLLATRAPILFAPAMNTNMYQHVATQANIETLRARGNIFIGPDSGRLACGTTGKGRMIDPQKIVEAAVALVGREEDFAGTRVLISSGRNHEPIDPVRYIANRSSGKMGRALAMEGLSRGAEVTVVSGPADVSMPYGVTETRVTTALEMRDAVLRHLPEADVFISVAAVADYRIKTPAPSKRKRGDGQVSLELVENPDILAEAGSRKLSDQVLVGFAAETDDLSENAADKLRKKKVDLMVANQVGTEESGFGTDTLRAQFISRDGAAEDLGLIPKEELAARLFDYVRILRDARKTSR